MQQRQPKRPCFRATTNLTIGLLLVSASLNAAEKWRMQYFYDKDASAVAFTDLQCPSAKRCFASGVLQEGKRDQGVVATTADSGANWSLEEVKEHPVSLFFLNENKGWMVTDRGIWESADTGSTLEEDSRTERARTGLLPQREPRLCRWSAQSGDRDPGRRPQVDPRGGGG